MNNTTHHPLISLFGFLTLLTLLSLPLPALSSGERISSSISPVGDVDSHSFYAPIGAPVRVGFADSAGSSFTPVVSVSAPSGSLIESTPSSSGGTITFQAPESGNYSISVSDSGNDGTGTYALEAHILDGDLTGDLTQGSLTNSVEQPGSLNLGDYDHWTFDATRGDAIRLGIGRTGGSSGSDVGFEVFDPDGISLGLSDSFSNYGTSKAFPASKSGTYSVLVSESNLDELADYLLDLNIVPQSFNPSADDGTLVNTLEQAGDLVFGDFDRWNFTVSRGDAVRIGVGRTSGSSGSDVGIEVFDPNGASLGSSSYTNYGTSFSFTASQSGTFSLLVSELNHDETASYLLDLIVIPQSFTPSTDDGPLTNTLEQAGDLDLGDYDLWTFDANCGDTIRLGIGRTGGSSGSDVGFEVFTPDGVSLGHSSYSNYGSSFALNAVLEGTYYVLVSEFGRDETASYLLDLNIVSQAFTPSTDDGSLTNTVEQAGDLVFGDFDLWTFEATRGDSVRIGIGRTSGSSGSDVGIEVFDPDGMLLGSSSYSNYGSSFSFSSAKTGTYSILVSEANRDETASYLLDLIILPQSFTPSSDDGLLTNTIEQAGSLDLGDFDLWTFQADRGDSIRLGIGRTGGSSGSDVGFEIFDPNGSSLGFSNTYSNSGTHALLTTAQSGTYSILVSEFNQDETASYLLDFNMIPQSFELGAEDGALVADGQTSEVLSEGEYILKVFNANRGDFITLETLRTSGFIDLVIEVFAPSGASLGSTSASSNASFEFQAIEEGIYYVLLSDGSKDEAGSFDFTFEGFTGGPVVFPTPSALVPELNIHQLPDGNIELFWEQTPGFSLTSSPDLSTEFHPTPDPSLDNGTYRFVLTPSDKEFFQLKQQP